MVTREKRQSGFTIRTMRLKLTGSKWVLHLMWLEIEKYDSILHISTFILIISQSTKQRQTNCVSTQLGIQNRITLILHMSMNLSPLLRLIMDKKSPKLCKTTDIVKILLTAKERLWQFSSDSFQAGLQRSTHSPKHVSFYQRSSKLKNIWLGLYVLMLRKLNKHISCHKKIRLKEYDV